MRENKKSVAGTFLLAVLFGPIGQLYASPLGGSIAILISLGLAAINPALVLIVWFVCILTAPIAAHEYNRRLKSKAELIAA
jgi:hypothetical protein